MMQSSMNDIKEILEEKTRELGPDTEVPVEIRKNLDGATQTVKETELEMWKLKEKLVQETGRNYGKPDWNYQSHDYDGQNDTLRVTFARRVGRNIPYTDFNLGFNLRSEKYTVDFDY
ncbi:MAG: hypothetical protein ABEJ03_04520 [Candidatus Nanohaloarchaea archaeon]